MHKSLEKVLRVFLVFWGLYLIGESFLSFFNIRLVEVDNVWLPSATVYSRFMGLILGSMFLLAAILALEIQRDLQKYKNFVVLSSVWTIFHAGILIYLSIVNDYLKVYQNLPSLFVWIPFYNQFLLLEGTVLIIYSLLVWAWIKK